MTEHTLRIARLSHDLRGIAFATVDGEKASTWFVDGALPGEIVTARITKQHANRIEAQAIAISEPADSRVVPACQYVAQCGGCQLQHIDYAAQLNYKRDSVRHQLTKALGESAVPEVQLLHAEAWAYRRRARISARWDADHKQLALGFRAQQSQQIVDIDQCLVLEPRLSDMLPVLRAQLSQWSRPKMIGHVEMLASDCATALVIRLLAEPNEKESQLLSALAEQTGAQVLLQLEEGAEPVLWAGKPAALTYRHPASNIELSIAPNDFVQANGQANNLMIDRVLEALALQSTDRVLELFSGLGNFTLPVASQSQQVFAFEGSEALIERAQAQSKALNLKVRVAQMDLSQPKAIAGIAVTANKLLLDPPRTGADCAVTHLLLDGIERIVYVSCNPATLARDVQTLAGRGFALSELVCIDMFPQTAHIEAMAVLVRESADQIKQRTKQAKAQASKSQLSKNGFKRLKR